MYEFVSSTKPGRIGIKTPYNSLFVAEFKKIAGNPKWVEPTWFFDAIGREYVEELARRFFDTSRYVEYVVDWSLSNDHDGPCVDGMSLVDFGRDYYRASYRFLYQYVALESDLKSGGSRNNPTISGRIKAKVIARPGAVFTPSPDSVLESEIAASTPESEVASSEPVVDDDTLLIRLDAEMSRMIRDYVERTGTDPANTVIAALNKFLKEEGRH